MNRVLWCEILFVLQFTVALSLFVKDVSHRTRFGGKLKLASWDSETMLLVSNAQHSVLLYRCEVTGTRIVDKCELASQLTDPNRLESTEPLSSSNRTKWHFGSAFAIDALASRVFVGSPEENVVFGYDCLLLPYCNKELEIQPPSEGNLKPDTVIVGFGKRVEISNNLLIVSAKICSVKQTKDNDVSKNRQCQGIVYLFDCSVATESKPCTFITAFSARNTDVSSSFGRASAIQMSNAPNSEELIVKVSPTPDFASLINRLLRPNATLSGLSSTSLSSQQQTLIVLGAPTRHIASDDNSELSVSGQAFVYVCLSTTVNNVDFDELPVKPRCTFASALSSAHPLTLSTYIQHSHNVNLSDYFGSSIAVDGSMVAIGAAAENCVYLFDCLDPFSCMLVAQLVFETAISISTRHPSSALTVAIANIDNFGTLVLASSPWAFPEGQVFSWRCLFEQNWKCNRLPLLKPSDSQSSVPLQLNMPHPHNLHGNFTAKLSSFFGRSISLAKIANSASVVLAVSSIDQMRDVDTHIDISSGRISIFHFCPRSINSNDSYSIAFFLSLFAARNYIVAFIGLIWAMSITYLLTTKNTEG